MKSLNFSKFLVISVITLSVAASCKKGNNNATPTDTANEININQEEAKNGYMVLQADEIETEQWEFLFNANEEDKANVWIDLNNNATKDDGEQVKNVSDQGIDRLNYLDELTKYALDSQIIVIYGKIKGFACVNPLLNIDVSNNSNLEELYCPYSGLTALDVSKNTNLQTLVCYENQIKEDKLEALINSLPNSNQEKELLLVSMEIGNDNDLPTNEQIKSANAKNWVIYQYGHEFNNIVSINPKTYKKHDFIINEEASQRGYIILQTDYKINDSWLFIVDANDEDKDDIWIDLNSNGKREDNENITNFNEEFGSPVSSDKIVIYGKVSKLSCAMSCLENIDISNNSALKILFLPGNQLTSLDVSNNPELIMLDCSYNQLTSLDISKNTNLTDLECNNNKLTNLNVSHHKALERLDCSSNNLKEIDVSNNQELTTLRCSKNQIKNDKMESLINSLNNSDNHKSADIFSEKSRKEGNTKPNEAQIKTLESKNWRLDEK